MWRKRLLASDPSTAPKTLATPQEPEALDSLVRRLHWTVLRPIATRLGGAERSVVRGSGMELSEVREYRPGDDVRLIDWNLTARTQTTYVREAYAERALDVWFLVDLSPSVDWGTASCTKRERAVEFVAVATKLLGQHGNRTAALLFADQPLGLVPLGTGRNHFLYLLNRVRETRARPGDTTKLTDALAQFEQLVRRRSLVIVISDFLVEEGWQFALRKLARRHEVLAVRISDPREMELPDVGIITLEDPETGRQLTVDTSSSKLRERYKIASQAQTAKINTDLAGCGVDRLELDTNGEMLPTLISFLETHRLKRGLRAGLTCPVAS